MVTRIFEDLAVNGVRLRTVIEGDGPLVVLLHGWPQCWYLWRHQIAPIVAAGYRVAVPDQRGFGGSSKPTELGAYHIEQLCADVDGIREALGYDEFIVIGQDWGCLVAWMTALLYPQTCSAVMGLSVPFWRFTSAWIDRPETPEKFWYMHHFQQPGYAESVLDQDLENSIRTIYWALSADSPHGTWMSQLEHDASSTLIEALPSPGNFSAWLTEEDIAYYVEQYRGGGFGPPINWYRNIAANAEFLEDKPNLRFTQPAAFAIGELDDVGLYDPRWPDSFADDFDDLRFVETVKGAGHWVQAEKPRETNELILKFLASL
ncbi:MAG: alpha/beta fold hydrolase [Gammaproteobacteria bacterium]